MTETAIPPLSETVKEEVKKLRSPLEGGEKAWKELGFIGRQKESFNQVWSNAKTGMKITRVTGILAGVLLMGSSVKNIVGSPKIDEEGKEIPKNFVWEAGKLGGGAALVFASCVAGGKSLALGKA